jgi:hypothetical protein
LVNNNISETGRICRALKMEGLLLFLVELDIIQIALHCREENLDIFNCEVVLKIIGQYCSQQCRFLEQTHIPRGFFWFIFNLRIKNRVNYLHN